jgi:hypothetical protein
MYPRLFRYHYWLPDSGYFPVIVHLGSVLLAVKGIENLLCRRVLLLEYFGSPGDLAETDMVLFSNAPLGMALTKLFEKLPSKDDVIDFLGGEYLLEKGDHFLVI